MLASSAMGASVVAADGQSVGRVVDLVARFADDGYPPVTGALVRGDGGEVFVPIGRVVALGGDRLVLSTGGSALTPFERRAGEVLLGRDVVGRQLIYIGDHHRGRLVRADDIVLANRQGSWLVDAVRAGPRRHWWHRRSARAARQIDWSNVEPFVSHVPTSRLRLRARRLVQLHPGEIADLVEEATPAEADEIIEAVGEDREFEADVFEELDQDHQLDLVARRSDQQVAELLDKMAADDAADLLAEIDQSRREPILALMTAPARQRLRDLLRYNPQTAGGLMSPGGLCVALGATVADALERLRSAPDLPDTLDTVLVVDGTGILRGAVRLVELIRAPVDAEVATLGQDDPPRVHTGADLVEVTLTMTDYNLTTLAVVDETERVVGVVTIDDVVEQLVPENWRRRAEAAAE